MPDKDWAVPALPGNLTICFYSFSPNNNVIWLLCPVSETGHRQNCGLLGGTFLPSLISIAYYYYSDYYYQTSPRICHVLTKYTSPSPCVNQENVRVYLSCTTAAASAQTSSTPTAIMAASATRQRIWALRCGVLKSRCTHVKTVCIYTWLIYTLHIHRAAAEPSACIYTCLTRCSQHTHMRARC